MAYMDFFPMYHMPAHMPKMLGFAALATLAVCQAVQPGRLVRCQRLLALRRSLDLQPPAGCGVPDVPALAAKRCGVPCWGLAVAPCWARRWWPALPGPASAPRHFVRPKLDSSSITLRISASSICNTSGVR